MDGYSAEARGRTAVGVGIPLEQHYGLMSEVARAGNCVCYWRRRYSLIPDILLLDEPTNNADIDTIRWLRSRC